MQWSVVLNKVVSGFEPPSSLLTEDWVTATKATLVAANKAANKLQNCTKTTPNGHYIRRKSQFYQLFICDCQNCKPLCVAPPTFHLPVKPESSSCGVLARKLRVVTAPGRAAATCSIHCGPIGYSLWYEIEGFLLRGIELPCSAELCWNTEPNFPPRIKALQSDAETAGLNRNPWNSEHPRASRKRS